METQPTYSVPESLAVSDSGFLFLASTGETFTLNAIGREVFLLLKQGESGTRIKEALLAAYDVDATTLERDLEDFITQLRQFRLVVAR